MQWSLVQMRSFTKLWSDEGLTDDDLQALEAQIMEDPARWPVMRRTGRLRKARFAPPSSASGKSGSLRIGYAQFPAHRLIYFVTLFAKRKQENLNAAECRIIRQILDQISDELEKGFNR